MKDSDSARCIVIAPTPCAARRLPATSPKFLTQVVSSLALACAGFVALFFGLAAKSRADDSSTPFIQVTAESDVAPAQPVSGALVICGGGKLPDEIWQRFLELAGGPKSHIVVITTASMIADNPDEVLSSMAFWRSHELASLEVLHTRSRDKANEPEFGKILETATGVWFIGGSQSRVVDIYLDTATEKALRGVLQRGGVIGGTSAGAAIMSPVMIRGGSGDGQTEVGKGFGFLPGTVVDQHFLKRNRQERLLNVLGKYPGFVGIGIDEGTALVVQGRRMTVLGDSHVVTCLSASSERPTERPVATQTLKTGDEADLVALSRAAIARAQPRSIAAELATPEVSKGTLIVVGGGNVPPEATQRFISAAGGPDAPILVVSTALGDDFPETDVVGWLGTAGAKNVRRIHACTVQEVQDPALHEAIAKAQAIWFTGGRQWRLVDAFLDTPVQKLFHELLQRGGVIGGTSAGATILGSYLVRGNPLRNSEIMAEGYERGFGLLPGVAIDQHFRQRNRFADMAALKRTYPQLVGLGVDEGTALVIRGHVMEVVGKHQVAVYNRQDEAAAGDTVYETLHAGDYYDFREGRRMAREAQVAQATDSEDEDNDENEENSSADDSVRESLCR